MKSQRFAVYKSLEYNFECVQQIPDGKDDYLVEGYVRVSEIEEVSFIPRHEGDIRSSAIESVDAMRGKILKDYSEKITQWDEKKKQLLALAGPITGTKNPSLDDDIPF